MLYVLIFAGILPGKENDELQGYDQATQQLLSCAAQPRSRAEVVWGISGESGMLSTAFPVL